MDPSNIALLIAGGLVAGVVNTLAGGGSLITVPLLVLVGLPGTVANGTNRVGVLAQCLVGVWRFEAEGVSELRAALRVLVPTSLGSLAGAIAIAQVSDRLFEQLFAAVMLVLLVPMLRGKRSADEDPAPAAGTPARGGAGTRVGTWSAPTTIGVFFLIGVYGGAIQAGVGIVLLFALTRAGLDLVRANAFKLVVTATFAVVSVPVFVVENRIEWLPAAIVSIGFVAGAALGARVAIRGGERVIRPVLVVSVVALAGRMFGLY